MRLLLCTLQLTSAVLELARPTRTIRIAPPDRPVDRGGAVAAWHAERKNAITRKLGAEVIARLETPTPGRTLGCLVAADALLIGLATYTPHLDGLWWLGFASTLGAYCSLAQFALLHDVARPLHVTTARRLPEAIVQGQRNVVVMLNRRIELAGLGVDDWSIWWAANLGAPGEQAVRGRVVDVLGRVAAARERAAEVDGWVMDLYLLRAPA